MGAKPKMPGGGYGIPERPTGYYQPQAQSTDWLKAINQGWKPYEPQKVQTGYTAPTSITTSYTPYEQNALNAVQAFQSGQATQQQVGLALEQMKAENAQANAQLSQAYEQLKTQTGLEDRQLQLALGQLYQSAYKDDYTRSLEEQRIMQEFNISKAQLEQAKWVAEQQAAQAKSDWWSNLIGNIIGSGAEVVGGIFGGKKAVGAAVGAGAA